MTEPAYRSGLIIAGALLGIGLGGFLDGILFHQILQTHSMLSAQVPRDTVAGLEVNMFWDGMFHVLTWVVTVAGLAYLWTIVVRGETLLSTQTFVGSLALGWGLFNLVEGLINHHILHLHHVVEAPDHFWADVAFLLSGVILIAGGAALIWGDRRTPSEAPAA
jgi:uncharacterized membrane protein